jgi:hypothetical protein
MKICGQAIRPTAGLRPSWLGITFQLLGHQHVTDGRRPIEFNQEARVDRPPSQIGVSVCLLAVVLRPGQSLLHYACSPNNILSDGASHMRIETLGQAFTLSQLRTPVVAEIQHVAVFNAVVETPQLSSGGVTLGEGLQGFSPGVAP